MIVIRALQRDEDFADLIKLSREFFTEYEAHHKEFFKIDELTGEDVNAYFLSFCGQDTRKAYIVLDKERIVGYINSEQLQTRMRLRMALHCLDIILPREHSFDRSDAENFEANLVDFKAILAGEENPQGYG